LKMVSIRKALLSAKIMNVQGSVHVGFFLKLVKRLFIV
jgi:hypothetical protein